MILSNIIEDVKITNLVRFELLNNCKINYLDRRIIYDKCNRASI